jgi:hypothetical protein
MSTNRFVIIVGSAFHSVDLSPQVLGLMAAQVPALANMEPLHAFFKPADRMFPLKEGDELFIDAPNAEVNHKMQFRFDVAFGEPGIIEGESLLPTLHEMVNVVANVVTRFDSML